MESFMKTVCSPWGIVSYEFPNQGLMDIKGGFDDIVLDVDFAIILNAAVGCRNRHAIAWRPYP